MTALAKREPAAVAMPLDGELIAKLVLEGDLKGLTPAQRVAYYNYRCKALDLDPATQPFDLINLQGKLTLYAKKECASQLSSKRGLSATIINQGVQGDLYVVQARCKGPDGRETDDLGAVSIKGKAGDELCNAMMKAATKAKRRAILTHCGLGMLDESELETVRRGWNDSGSQAAADAVAQSKIEEMRAAATTSPESAGPALDIEEDPLGPIEPPDEPYRASRAGFEPLGHSKAQETASQKATGPRKCADPAKLLFLYPEQAADMRVFTKLKRSVGEAAYRTCLGSHGYAKSNYIESHAAADKVLADLRETEKAQKKQRELERQKANAEMDAASLLCHRDGSGCSIPLGNQIAKCVSLLKWDYAKANAAMEAHRKAGEEWETILVRFADLVEQEARK